MRKLLGKKNASALLQPITMHMGIRNFGTRHADVVTIHRLVYKGSLMHLGNLALYLQKIEERVLQ